MRQVTRITATLLALALLASPAALSEGFDCLTYKCCWDDYISSLRDCRMAFGQIIAGETDSQRKLREELTKACLAGAKDMLKTCNESVEKGQAALDPKLKSRSLNGGNPMSVAGDVVADVFEFELNVSADEAGPWTLFIANGLPDLPGLDGAIGGARAAGLVEVNGRPVLGREPFDERTYDLRIPLVLTEGQHRMRFTLTNTDPANSHAYVTAALLRD